MSVTTNRTVELSDQERKLILDALGLEWLRTMKHAQTAMDGSIELALLAERLQLIERLEAKI